jgi:Flp pilus assembly protein TadD
MLGQFEMKTGRIDRAVAAFQRALAADPGNALARYDLGLLYLSVGQVDLARQEHVQLEAIDPALANQLSIMLSAMPR